MKIQIYLFLLFFMQFGFAQKQYTFNLYFSYESRKDNNHFQQIVFSDTIKNNYKLLIHAKNGKITDLIVADYEVGEIYRFKIYNKNFKGFEISDNLKDYEIFQMSNLRNRNNNYCIKHYDRNLQKLNDSVNVETFTFYKNRRKKKITSITTIQILSSKHIKNRFPSDEIGMIIECIDKSYESKIIKHINNQYFDGKKLKFEHSNNLLEMHQINFNFIIQK